MLRALTQLKIRVRYHATRPQTIEPIAQITPPIVTRSQRGTQLSSIVIMSFDAEKKLPRGGVGAFYMSSACGKDLFGREFLFFYGKNYGPRVRRMKLDQQRQRREYKSQGQARSASPLINHTKVKPGPERPNTQRPVN